MNEDFNQSNVKRFSGFSDCYDKNRPQAPMAVVEILNMYLGKKPGLVVDMGCGTGLSTFIWRDFADKVIGVEPNEDMINIAEKNRTEFKIKNIDFKYGLSNQTGLESGSADIVTCSQAFHWMEPQSTIREVVRILKKGGIFAVYDCDWPPSINQELEIEYKKLMKCTDELFEKINNEDVKVKKWNKEKHLENIQKSNAFVFTREIVFHNKEKCDADRFIGLALSQGHLQTVIKFLNQEINPLIERFKSRVENIFRGR
jgi:ubiquinone/menaquinone biosynthesis C-methylase UbiE